MKNGGKEGFLNVTKVRPKYERGWGGAWRVGQKERAERVLVVTFVREQVCLQQRDAGKGAGIGQKWVRPTSDSKTNIL